MILNKFKRIINTIWLYFKKHWIFIPLFLISISCDYGPDPKPFKNYLFIELIYKSISEPASVVDSTESIILVGFGSYNFNKFEGVLKLRKPFKDSLKNNMDKDYTILGYRRLLAGNIFDGEFSFVHLFDKYPYKTELDSLPIIVYEDIFEIENILSDDNIIFIFNGKTDTIKSGSELNIVREYYSKYSFGLLKIYDTITIKNHGRFNMTISESTKNNNIRFIGRNP
jgi:hypothetical protein